VFKLEGRAAIYISKRFDVGQRDFEMSENWCRVWFPEMDLGQGICGFELWSIYNPPSSKGVPSVLSSRPKPSHPVVLAGEQLSSNWGLVVRTKGAVTRAPQGRQRGHTSTIDHFWTPADLHTIYYGEEFRGKSDHYPQVLEVGEGERPMPAQPAGWNRKRMNKLRVKAESKLLYKAIGLTDPGPDRLMVRIRTVDGLRRLLMI
jgi:hypothetical protein